MKKSIKLIPAIVLSLSMLSPALTTHATGLPVFDAANAINALQQIIHMKEQIDNQIEQISQLKKQLEAVTGSKDIGSALGNIADQLPDEWQSIYNSVGNADYKKLIQGKNYTPETALKQLTQDHELSIKAFNDTKRRLDNIQKMIQKIDETEDLKAAQDLQNRIAAESAIIQNNQTKLDMMARLAAQQEKIQYYKRMDRRACYTKNHKDNNGAACNN